MRAITLLKLSGLTGPAIANAIDQTTHSVRLYERGERFPKQAPYIALVRLAESRGLMLLARDFVDHEASSES